MQRILLLLVIFVTYSSAVQAENSEEKLVPNIQPYIMENIIKEKIKQLSIALKAYDPFLIRNTSYEVESSSINVEIKAKDILLRGFSNFAATNIKNDVTIRPPGIKSTFNVKFDELHVIVPYYFLDGLAVFVPLYGSGAINLVAREVHGGAFAKVKKSLRGALTLYQFELKLNISKTDLFITGVLNNEPLSQIVSTSTSECFSEFVNTYNDRLGKLLGERLIDPINKILNSPKKPKTNLNDFNTLIADSSNENDFSNIDVSEEDDDSLNKNALDSSINKEEAIDVGPYSLKIKTNI